MIPLALPATCLLAVSEIEVSVTEAGWEERSHLEVLGNGRCPHVDVQLPEGGRVTRLRARVQLADGGRHRIDADRQTLGVRQPDGSGRVRLHTPEVLTGDRILIDLVRELPAADYHWTPAAFGGRYASLDSSQPFQAGGAERTSFWVADASEQEPVVVAHPTPAPPTALGLPPTPSSGRLQLTLEVPGEPQRTLYPGGGSSYQATWTFEHTTDSPARLVVPLPPSVDDLEVDGPHEVVGRSVLLELGSASSHTVRYRADDAPTHGVVPVLPGVETSSSVTLPDGRIRWEDDRFWWVSTLGMRRITPDRRDLVRALDARFRRAALPEPAVPVHLRGSVPNEAAVDALRAALQLRAGVADLPLDPLFPRRLSRARRTGALTSLEASLVLAMQLGQLGARSTWALIAPVPAEQASRSTPVGYTEGLTVVMTAEGPAFVDPGCTVCAPFEVRPVLQGTRMLSPAGEVGPPVVEGRTSVVDDGEHRRVRLEGPPALLLRLDLVHLPADQRLAALTERFGGAGATLISSTGLGRPGEPIELVLQSPALPDPSVGIPEGWVGERTWKRPEEAVRPPSPPETAPPAAPPGPTLEAPSPEGTPPTPRG